MMGSIGRKRRSYADSRAMSGTANRPANGGVMGPSEVARAERLPNVKKRV